MDNLKDHIAKLREDFTSGVLNESAADKSPAGQFKKWLAEAVEARVPEVQAMNLATVSHDLKPSSRIVYLREFDNNTYSFYTNYQSRKGVQLSSNAQAALCFFWPELERQVRIEGTVEKLSPEKSDQYFNFRPFDSKVGAWASPQSQVLESRDELDKKVLQIKEKFSPESIVRPDFWGGYLVRANYYEFWQGRKSRLHDRLFYELSGTDNWLMGRIAP